ncbi:MAG: HipA domain-containing protein [Hydrogenovibrio sp.]|uniref:HipA domain-containing protein n=1 Tax=Hydrogenovibrio sp. TaxID=2065821 RepID=UPI0028700270|nr:HipA domain-containing protein [Hydrogenovibrio sp.]MDR9498214.1 HipA domain-containing protein [Hydrogenovibrio sp.]
MARHETRITQALQYENLSASALAKLTGISQPTVSRTLKKLPVLKLGAGPKTVFALMDASWPCEPLYEINANGRVSRLGDLYRQPQDRTLLVQDWGHQSHDGLPYYLYDAIPSGFLGALHLKQLASHDPRLTAKSQDWSDRQIWHYLTHYGDDLQGNLVLGKRMAALAADKDHPIRGQTDYSDIVHAIHREPENMGSSIAGEQPKFTLYNGQNHLIVKYSPLCSEDNPVAVRHRDLMVCEHLALTSLNEAGISASETRLHMDDRFYLEINRFDRTQNHGRRGLVSLKYLDAAFAGINGDWPEIVRDLLQQKIISKQDLSIVETVHAFGKYIANTDMHLGNLSFFLEGLQVTGVTPIYDMLPMAYMPVQGEIRNPETKPPRFIDVSDQAQEAALKIAVRFWEAVMENPMISDRFKTVVAPLVKEINQAF